MRQSQLYCHHLDGRMGKWYAHFYESVVPVKMCGSEPIHKATVRELPESSPVCYWAFWRFEDQVFHYVYPDRRLVDICFPYGLKSAEEHGEGICLPVEIIDGGLAESEE